MNRVTSYKSFWAQRFERERRFYETFEEEFPVWENWKANTCPNLEAELCLVDALRLMYADARQELIDKFLGWPIDLINRGFAEHKFQPERSQGSFPRNRGEGLRARAYAMALRGEQLPLADLLQATHDYQEWSEGIVSGTWDMVTEALVLAPARLALIAGDLDRFSQLLPFRYKIKRHKEEADLLLQLKNALQKSRPLPPELCERFNAYFQRVRDPQFKSDKYMETDILRFELGVLYCQYVAADEPFSWQRVIAEISR